MARPTEFIRQDATNYDLTLLQDRLQDFFRVLDGCPLLEGRLIENVALTAAVETKVEHKLGRLPEGWIVVDRRSVSGDIIRTSESTTLFLNLTSTADQIVSLWVF